MGAVAFPRLCKGVAITRKGSKAAMLQSRAQCFPRDVATGKHVSRAYVAISRDERLAMFSRHNITVTTTSPNGGVTWEVKDAYGSSEDAALRGYLAFQTAFYVNGGSLNTVAALLATTYRNDGSHRTFNAKNTRAHKRATTAHYGEELRRTDAYYAALRRDNPGW